jgi:hypothetical protein
MLPERESEDQQIGPQARMQEEHRGAARHQSRAQPSSTDAQSNRGTRATISGRGVIHLRRSRGYREHLQTWLNGLGLRVSPGGPALRSVRGAVGGDGRPCFAPRPPYQDSLAPAIEQTDAGSVRPNALGNTAALSARSVCTSFECMGIESAG